MLQLLHPPSTGVPPVHGWVVGAAAPAHIAAVDDVHVSVPATPQALALQAPQALQTPSTGQHRDVWP